MVWLFLLSLPTFIVAAIVNCCIGSGFDAVGSGGCINYGTAVVFIVECEVVCHFCIVVSIDVFWFGIGGFVVERGYI